MALLAKAKPPTDPMTEPGLLMAPLAEPWLSMAPLAELELTMAPLAEPGLSMAPCLKAWFLYLGTALGLDAAPWPEPLLPEPGGPEAKPGPPGLPPGTHNTYLCLKASFPALPRPPSQSSTAGNGFPYGPTAPAFWFQEPAPG